MPAQKAARPNSLGEIIRAARYGFRPISFEHLPRVFVRLTSLRDDKYRMDAFVAGDQEFLQNPIGKNRHVVWWEDPETKRVIADVVSPFLEKILRDGLRSFTVTETGELLEIVEN